MENAVQEIKLEKLLEQSKEFIINLTTVLESQKPDVEFSKAMQNSEGFVTMQKASASLFTYFKDRGVQLGRNHLLEYLRTMKILQKNNSGQNVPYQQYITAGYFKVVMSPKPHGMVASTLVSGKGLKYIQKRLLKYIDALDSLD